MTHHEPDPNTPHEGEDEDDDHDVPADLLELHEALEFQDALRSQGATQ